MLNTKLPFTKSNINMTVSTLNRRAFFQKLRSESTEKTEQRMGIFGKMKPVFPLGNQELPLVPPPTTTVTLNGGLEPYTGPWDYEQAAHLLRRTTFGVKKNDLELLVGMTMDEAVNHILLDLPPPLDPINNYSDDDPTNEDDYDDPAVPAGQTWVDANYDNDAEGYRIESYRGWWIDLMVNQEANIREKMTLFWHNHFATQTDAVFYGKVNYRHNRLLRSHALGNFKQFTKEVTLDPMMLFYLNGYLNVKDAPDENYARELQELFTVGKDNPDHYTEDDVVAAARVLTGWSIDWNNFDTTIPSIFNAGAHDIGDKQFSAFYGNTVITGSFDGDAELNALLDMIFQKNEVAEFLVRKLYRWFIYYNIDAAAEANLIQPLAQIFRSNGYEIKPVMETLLKSTHFFDAVNKGCFIKTPVDIVVGTMRSFNLGIPSITLWDDFVMKSYLRYFHSVMQMLPGDPPNVAGWQAFRQVPQFYRMWINGDTARNRNFYIAAMFSGNLASSNDNVLRIDPIAFASQFSDPSNPVTLVDEMVKLLLPQPISDLKKTLLKSILLSGLPSDSYWTIEWIAYVNNPNDPMSVAVVNTRLTNMIAYILLLPEYQLA